jgi:hypothetical protein
MNFREAALNIGTLGYHSYQKSLKLQETLKSLQDSQLSGGAITAFNGPSVRQDQRPETAQKQNVQALRTLAETNPWVRAAIKIYRDKVAGATPVVVTKDPSRPMNETVKAEIEALIANPTPRNTPYTTLKKMMVEDYLVLGHGVLRKKIRRDLVPYQFDIVDAQRFAFIKNWDGSPDKPHYAIIDPAKKTILEYLADQQAMVLFNSMRSYDNLGLSHVEVLFNALTSLSDGDEFLKSQVMNPTPSGMLQLGQGFQPTQADQVRAQLMANKYPFLIAAGGTGTQWVPFTASPKDLQILEAQVWFVRQICALFDISTADLALAVDTSRANTEAMQVKTSEGQMTLLEDIRDLENEEITLKYGSYEEHNCYLDYPVLNQRDEVTQTDIAVRQTASGLSSINESRAELGKEPLKLPIADDLLITVGNTIQSVRLLNQQLYGTGQTLLPQPVEQDQGQQDSNSSHDKNSDKGNDNSQTQGKGYRKR